MADQTEAEELKIRAASVNVGLKEKVELKWNMVSEDAVVDKSCVNGFPAVIRVVCRRLKGNRDGGFDKRETSTTTKCERGRGGGA